MAFSTHETDDVLSEINITPLVDVMLVLLVAFIVTAPLLNNAIHVNLPKTVATSKPDQQKPLTLSVDKDKRLWLDRTEIPLATLPAELLRRKAANPDLALHLQADDEVPYGPVAKVMAAIEAAGVTRVSVLTTQ